MILARSYRENGKQKRETIANLTKMPKELVDGLEAVIKNKGSMSLEQMVVSQGKSCGGLYVFSKIANRVGLSKALGRSDKSRLALMQVIARIMKPCSQLSLSTHWKSHNAVEEVLGVKDFNHHDLYATLDWLEENQAKIEDKLFRDKHKGRKLSEIYLYDVTSSYLEGQCNELGQFGYNRDKKKGKKQIVIGLLCDGEGEPVSVEVFEGNTNDTKTFSSQLKKLKERFGLEKVVMVGDKGMIKSAQIAEITEEKYHYITTVTKAQIRSLLKEGVIQLSLFENELIEVEDEGVRYLLRRNPTRDKETKQTRVSKIEKIQQLVDNCNAYLKEHPRAHVKTSIKKVLTKIEKYRLHSFVTCTQKAEQRKVCLVIDQKAKDKAEELDGCYVVKTDLPKEDVKAEIVHQRYKDLGKVENAFRTMKTTLLQIRPLYLRKANRTRGLAFLCMLAYKLVWHFRQAVEGKININVKDAIDALDRIQYLEYPYNDFKIKRLPDNFTGEQQQILDLLGIKLPKNL